MSTNTNDGGPAFPTMTYDQVAASNGIGISVTDHPGMTLRDYFAVKVEGLADDVTLEYAEVLAGRKRPDVVHGSPENILEWVLFWADADAALRYIKADAMLRARENTNDPE